LTADKSMAKDSAPRSGRNARRRAREFAVQGIYQWLVAGSDAGVIEANLTGTPGFERCDNEHFKTLLHGIISSYSLLHEKIEPHLDRKISLVSPVERSALLVGTYELLHHPEIPYRVVISESIDLTKVFGGTDGFKFVNGVLDKVAADCGVAQGRR